MLLLMVPIECLFTLYDVFGGFARGHYILLVCALRDQVPGDFHVAFAGRPDQRRPLLLVLHVLVPPLQQALLQLLDVPLLHSLLKLVRPVTALRTDHRFQVLLRFLRR